MAICIAFSLSDVIHWGWIHRGISKKLHPLVLSSEFHFGYNLSFFALKTLMKVLGALLGGLHFLVGLFFEARDIFPLCVFCKNADRNDWINNFNMCHLIQHFALNLVSENIKFFVPLSSQRVWFFSFVMDPYLWFWLGCKQLFLKEGTCRVPWRDIRSPCACLSLSSVGYWSWLTSVAETKKE